MGRIFIERITAEILLIKDKIELLFQIYSTDNLERIFTKETRNWSSDNIIYTFAYIIYGDSDA